MSSQARHFRWTEQKTDRPIERLARRTVRGDRFMVNEITLEKGCVVPLHRHENEQMTLVLSGCLRMGLDEAGASFVDVRAGEVLHLPSDTPHSAEALEDTVVLDVFSPPAERTGVDQG